MDPHSKPAGHVFDDAIALEEAQGEGGWRGQTHPAYWNAVGPFGGITAAQALSAVLRHPGLLGEPVSLTINFCAALAEGAFDATARPVRTNRSTQHWTIEIRQGGAVVLTATALTAQRRSTWSVDEDPMPGVAAVDQCDRTDLSGKVEWPQRYDMRMLEGNVPRVWDGSGSGSLTRLWVRDEPPRMLDFASLTALCDVFYPRAWLRRSTMTPAGTVSMTVYYHAGSQQLRDAGSSHVLAQARAQAFRNGFFDQAVHVWSQAGALLATSHQIVYYKE